MFPADFILLAPDGDIFLILTHRDEDSKSVNACNDEVCPHLRKLPTREDRNDTSQRQIRVRCSSAHLILASSVFEAMLSQSFKENLVVRSPGTVDLPLPDDDPIALLMLLNIIHGQTKDVPLEVDMCMLTRLAIVVDKYQLHVVVGIVSRIWIDRLKANIPKTSMGNLQRWIFISWAFRSPSEFKTVTKIAKKHSEIRIDEYGDLDVPVPCSIVDEIDQHRQRLVFEIITLLHSVLERYQRAGPTCGRICDAILVGSLTKAMNSIQMLIPPEPPYSHISFSELAWRVRFMPIFTYFGCSMRQTRGYADDDAHPLSFLWFGGCSTQVKDDIEDALKSLEEGICGLDLMDWEGQIQ